MIKQVLKSIALIVLVAVAFASCQKEEVFVRKLDPVSDANIIKHLKAKGENGIPFPAGSTVVKIDELTHRIKLPANYFYVVKNEESNSPATVVTLDVTCSCKLGTGCSPVSFKERYYCVLGSGCTSCDKSTSTSLQSTNSKVELLGLINKNAAISTLSDQNPPPSKIGDFIDNHKIIRSFDVIHGNAFAELFELPAVKSYFAELGESYQANKIRPDRLLYMNVYGNLMLVPYEGEFVLGIGEQDYVAKSIFKGTLEKTIESITCECHSGSGCKKDKTVIPFVGTAYWCNAGKCSKCTLHD